MLLFSSYGLCLLIYSEAMMILTLITQFILFDWCIYTVRVVLPRVCRDRCLRRMNRFLLSYPFLDCLSILSLSMIIFHCCLGACVLFSLGIIFRVSRGGGGCWRGSRGWRIRHRDWDRCDHWLACGSLNVIIRF